MVTGSFCVWCSRARLTILLAAAELGLPRVVEWVAKKFPGVADVDAVEEDGLAGCAGSSNWSATIVAFSTHTYYTHTTLIL